MTLVLRAGKSDLGNAHITQETESGSIICGWYLDHVDGAILINTSRDMQMIAPVGPEYETLRKWFDMTFVLLYTGKES